MNITARLLLIFIVMSLLGLAFIVVVFFSTWQEEKIGELQASFSETASQVFSKNYHNLPAGKDINLYLQDKDGKVRSLSKKKLLAESPMLFSFQPEFEKHLVDIGTGQLLWMAFPHPNKKSRLIISLRADNLSFYSYLNRYGTPVIVIALIFLWVSVWTALIVAASYRRIEKQNRELEKQSNDLNEARQHAEEASFAKSNFLANMSHELRTPLNAIIGYSEILLEEFRDGDIEDAERDLNKVHTAAKHLLTLINDVLDLSRIEAGKMSIVVEQINLHNLVSEVVSVLQPVAAQRGNKLELNINEQYKTIYSDAVKLRQIIYNIVSNACKFTENGQISLSVSYERKNNEGFYRFIITDNGIGMSSRQLANIFNPFVQADSSITRSYGGTGLGLSITRRFVEMLGGMIVVDSEQGKGSVFTVLLPEKSRVEPDVAQEPGQVEEAGNDTPPA